VFSFTDVVNPGIKKCVYFADTGTRMCTPVWLAGRSLEPRALRMEARAVAERFEAPDAPRPRKLNPERWAQALEVEGLFRVPWGGHPGTWYEYRALIECLRSDDCLSECLLSDASLTTAMLL